MLNCEPRLLLRLRGIRCAIYFLIVFLFSPASFGADETKIAPSLPTNSNDRATPWTSLNALDSDNRFHFAVVTDRTGGERLGIFEPAMQTVNLMQPAFVVSVGDLIEGYTKNRVQLRKEWDELDSFVGQLDAPFFYTAGNHDY